MPVAAAAELGVDGGRGHQGEGEGWNDRITHDLAQG
jgi:hypothetical protein